MHLNIHKLTVSEKTSKADELHRSSFWLVFLSKRFRRESRDCCLQRSKVVVFRSILSVVLQRCVCIR